MVRTQVLFGLAPNVPVAPMPGAGSPMGQPSTGLSASLPKGGAAVAVTSLALISNAISSLISRIDGNRLLDLTITDMGGMCIPRTGIEALQRPPGFRQDAARETAIREFSGLFLNTFAVGWASFAAIRLLGNKVNWYNPNGIPPKAWISADSLETFGRLYENILKDPSIKTAEAARSELLRTLLSNLTSTDRKTMLASMLKSTEHLEPATRQQFLSSLFPAGSTAAQRLHTILQQNPTNLSSFTEELAEHYNGKLNSETVKKLHQAFSFQERGSEYVIGTTPFDKLAMERTQDLLLTNPAITKHLSAAQQQALHKLPPSERFEQLRQMLPDSLKHKVDTTWTKMRLQLSMGDLKYREKNMIDTLDRLALEGGLTDNVRLLNNDMEALVKDTHGKALMDNKSRQTVLKEIKYFLEQYVDRAAHMARHSGDQWKLKTAESLYGTSSKTGLLSKLRPQVDDGLIASSLKSKWAYTHVPLWTTVIVSIVVAFYNNWLTQKKHGGRLFFPGEGILDNTSNPKAVAAAKPATSAVSNALPFQASFPSIQKPVAPTGPFDMFSRQPNAGVVS